MITDLIISVVHSIYAGLVDLLPSMPERPAAISFLWQIMASVNVILPVEELRDFFPVMVGVFGALVVYRLIRFGLPGG